MRWKLGYLLVLALILLTSVASAETIELMVKNSPTGIAVPNTQDVYINLTSTLMGKLGGGPNTTTLAYYVRWDPTIITYDSYTMLWTHGNDASDESFVGTGKFVFNWDDNGAAKNQINNVTNMNLVKLTFHVIQNGNVSGINITNVQVGDIDAQSWTPSSDPAAFKIINGTFTTYFPPPPQATFSKSVSNVRTTTGSVTYTYTGSTVPPAYWNWTFGDGNGANNTASTAQTRSYASAGAKTVRLDVANSAGHAFTTDTVTVYDSPIPSFTKSSGTVATGNPVIFNGTSTGTITGWSWDFGTGATPPTSTNRNETVTWSGTGAKAITLRVTDPVGTNATPASDTVNVLQGPTAAFTTNVSAVRTNGGVKFTDASTGASITSWNWSFGDGTPWSNTTISSSPEHQYTTHGTCTASLTVVNAVGPNTATQQINVYDQPLGDFTTVGPTTVMTGVAVTFNGTTTGDVTGWSWDFGTGATPPTSTSRNQTVTYSTGGTKTVVLTRSNPLESNSTTKVDWITVTVPTLPIPRITSGGVTTGNVPLIVPFSSATSDAYSPSSYLWVFGDGLTSAAVNPSHTFTSAGNFQTNLSITNASGKGTSALYSIVVTESVAPPAPVNLTISGSSFSVNRTGNEVNYTILGNTVTLTNVSGYSSILVTMTGVDTTGGNLNGTITSVQYILPDTTSIVNGVTIHIQPSLTESGWSVNPFLLAMTIPNAVTEDPVYQANLPSGSIGYTSLAVINISSADTITGGTLNMSVPVSWYTSHSGSPSTPSTSYTAIVWTHLGTTTVLYPTWGPTDGVNQWFTITPPAFSTGGIVGATSAAASGGGGGGGSGGYSGGGGGGGGSYSSSVSSTKTATMLESTEGKALMTYVVSTGQQASLTVPLGTTIYGKDGKPLSTVSVVMTAVADVPAVPAGAVYSFAGYAVTCSPEGATFNPATSLKFSLNDQEWNDLMAKANSNTGYFTVKFYDATTGGWSSVPTTVDNVAHTVTGSVSHFSMYGLFVDTTSVSPIVIETTLPVPTVPKTVGPTVAPVKTTVAPTAAPSGGMPWTFIIGAIVIIVIIGGAGYYFMTKKKNL